MDEYDDWNIPANSPRGTLNEPTSDGKPWSFYKEPLEPLPQCPVKPPPYTVIDPFFKANKIMGLSGSTFQEFITDKDVVLVLFYNSSIYAKGDLQHKILQQLVKAAATTDRENHAYAALDCFNNKRFCTEEGVKEFPTAILYSKGECRGRIQNMYSVADKHLRVLVEASGFS